MSLNDKEEKTRMSLVPWLAVRRVAEIMTHGEKKYGANDWLTGGDWSRLVDAMFRHLLAWVDGELDDPETNKSHLAHAACNIMMLMELMERNIGNNDVHGSKPAKKRVGNAEYERDMLEKALQKAWTMIEDIDAFVSGMGMFTHLPRQWHDEIAPKIDKILGLADRRCPGPPEDLFDDGNKVDE